MLARIFAAVAGDDALQHVRLVGRGQQVGLAQNVLARSTARMTCVPTVSA